MKFSFEMFRGRVLSYVLAALTAGTAAADTIGYSWVSSIFGGNRQLYEIVLETGVATPLGVIAGLDLDGGCALPDGRIVAIDGFNAEYWELLPGGQLVGQPSMNGVDAGMHYDTTTDTLYAISGGQQHNFESSLLYRVDPNTGATTLIGEDPDHYAEGLAINAQGEAFAIDLTFRQILWRVDLNTGRLSIATFVTQPQGRSLFGGGLAFAPDGTLWMSNCNRGELYRIDIETGVATYVSRINAHRQGFWWNFLAIPLADPTPPGDLNCDGSFNGADIDPFFLALGDPTAYASQFPNCEPLNGDMNRDGRLDGADIDPFFACLGGGGCP